MHVTAVVLSALLAAAFAATSIGKLIGDTRNRGYAERLKLPYRAWRGIGVLEVAGALGLLIGLAVAPLGIAAAIGLILLMIGATVAHLRNNDAVSHLAPPVVLGVLAAATLLTRALST